jgi:hypothetical protein
MCANVVVVGIVDCMSVLSHQEPAAVAARRRFRLNRIGILVLGAIIVPFILTAAFNSYGALSEESAVRMAFATVGGQTIAILSGISVVAITIRGRKSASEIALSVIIALIILASAMGMMAGAGDLLVERLDLVAETNLLNR